MNLEKPAEQSKLLTLPNLLSLFRMLLIPVIAWAYTRNPLSAAGLLFLSGMTDVADGWIARHFQQTSDVGKVLDPIADKLTQTVMLICLVARHPLMLLPLCLLVVKEFVAAVLGLWVIRRTGQVNGAEWHGKAATALLYTMMGLHLLWPGMPAGVSHGSILLCTGMVLYSGVCYTLKNLRLLRQPQRR